MIINWLKTFLPEDPIRKVANVRQQNRIANILNGIQGVNCRVVKPTAGEGKGWLIVVDGGSDIKPTNVTTPPAADWPYPFNPSTPTPEGVEIEVIVAVRYDESSYELQYKTQTITVLAKDENPSDWITFHEAAECEPEEEA